MKTLTYLSFIMCLCHACIPPRTTSIQIDYLGEQSKPHGDLIISLKQYVLPTHKSLGFVFGQSLVTDMSTFKYILLCLKMYPFRKLAKEEGFYAIEADRQYSIPILNAEVFFDSLGRQIKLKKLDSAVGDAFIHHNEYWQGGKSIATATREDIWQYFSIMGLPSGAVYVNAPILSEEILTGQKKLYKHQISEQEKTMYDPVIKFSKKWTDRVVEQFVDSQSHIFRKMASLNYVVGYKDSSSSLVAWIWTSTDQIYRYENPAVKGGVFKRYDLYDLAPDDKKVIKYFMGLAGDDNKHDSTNKYSAAGGNYYLGSKIDTGSNKKAKTFAF